MVEIGDGDLELSYRYVGSGYLGVALQVPVLKGRLSSETVVLDAGTKGLYGYGTQHMDWRLMLVL